MKKISRRIAGLLLSVTGVRLFSVFFFIFLSTPAWAQFACGAAVEFGKYAVNECIDDGLPYCRTADFLNLAWSEALSSRRVLEYGGCTSENKLYDIYWDGTPASSEE